MDARVTRARIRSAVVLTVGVLAAVVAPTAAQAGESGVTVVAKGLDNPRGLAFAPDGSLYVLEITQNGLLSGDPSGALIKVGRDHKHETVLNTGLVTPGGLAIRDNAAYISNFGTAPGAGTVVCVPLH
jgi:glucose/arabinose dehydrogenase